jgi:hypothetical protein
MELLAGMLNMHAQMHHLMEGLLESIPIIGGPMAFSMTAMHSPWLFNPILGSLGLPPLA